MPNISKFPIQALSAILGVTGSDFIVQPIIIINLIRTNAA